MRFVDSTGRMTISPRLVYLLDSSLVEEGEVAVDFPPSEGAGELDFFPLEAPLADPFFFFDVLSLMLPCLFVCVCVLYACETICFSSTTIFKQWAKLSRAVGTVIFGLNMDYLLLVRSTYGVTSRMTFLSFSSQQFEFEGKERERDFLSSGEKISTVSLLSHS